MPPIATRYKLAGYLPVVSVLVLGLLTAEAVPPLIGSIRGDKQGGPAFDVLSTSVLAWCGYWLLFRVGYWLGARVSTGMAAQAGGEGTHPTSTTEWE